MGSDREPFSEPPGHGSGLSLPFCLLLEVLARVRLGGGADDSCSRNSSLDPEDHQPKKEPPHPASFWEAGGTQRSLPGWEGKERHSFTQDRCGCFPRRLFILPEAENLG